VSQRKSLLIRIRPDIWVALNRWAKDDFRSLNGQIEFLLHKALRDQGRLKQSDEAEEQED